MLKLTTAPDDTIIMTAALSGLRRGELFALQWPDLDPGNGRDGGVLHVRRGIYHGVISTPKTDGSERTVDVPQRLVDELAIYRLTYPALGDGFIFRTATGHHLEPDNWHHRHLVPLLKTAGLYKKGMGLHALRHGYVSLMAANGEDIGYIADQVGHSSVKLTQDVYRHTFAKARVESMRRLNESGAELERRG